MVKRWCSLPCARVRSRSPLTSVGCRRSAHPVSSCGPVFVLINCPTIRCTHLFEFNAHTKVYRNKSTYTHTHRQPLAIEHRGSLTSKRSIRWEKSDATNPCIDVKGEAEKRRIFLTLMAFHKPKRTLPTTTRGYIKLNYRYWMKNTHFRWPKLCTHACITSIRMRIKSKWTSEAKQEKKKKKTVKKIANAAPTERVREIEVEPGRWRRMTAAQRMIWAKQKQEPKKYCRYTIR